MAELTIPLWEVVLRLFLASLLCGALGFEREIRDQPAADVNAALTGISNLPEVERISLTGVRDYDEQ